MRTTLTAALVAAGAVIAAFADAQPAPTGLTTDVVFTAPSPLTGDAEVMRHQAEMKTQQDARVKLTKERAKWGDANVDVMVAQKDALLENFKNALGVLAGGKPPK